MRRATPRPEFTGSRIIRHSETVQHVWGDETSGVVFDRIYLSTRSLHSLEFQLAPGSEFRHSLVNPTIFAADVSYTVLEGEFIMANPQTGEVLPLRAGDTVLFHRDTWHHGFNPSPHHRTRVLEFFSPPPARGTASSYARQQPDLEATRYQDDRWEGRWPSARAEQAGKRTLHPIDDATALWSFASTEASHLIGTLVDTPFLRLQKGRVQPGHVDAFTPIEKEALLVVTEGELAVDIDESGEYLVGTLSPGDAAYLPAGCRLRILGVEGAVASYLVGQGCDLPDDWAP